MSRILSQENPYSPPISQAAPPVKTDKDGSGNASQGKRFLGYLIDQVVLFGIGIIQGMAVVLVTGIPETAEQAMANQWTNFALGWLITFLFYVIVEGTTGRTLGKLAMGTRVVNVSGGKASFGQILGRTAARFIPFEAFSFFFGCDTKFPTGWHDRLSSTRVINA